MTALYQLATAVPEAERNARIYRGELIVFRGFDAMAQLTDRLRAHCIHHLCNDPTCAHQSMSAIEIEHAAEAVRTAVREISLLPGDLLCFSGAHLHASVPNTTELTRLSFETRTVNRADMAAGSGAPDVDGSAPFITPQIFRHLKNGRKLGELVRK